MNEIMIRKPDKFAIWYGFLKTNYAMSNFSNSMSDFSESIGNAGIAMQLFTIEYKSNMTKGESWILYILSIISGTREKLCAIFRKKEL